MGRYYPMDSDNSAIPAERKEQTMSRYIDADEQMTRIKQVYESMGVDTHGIWNKQLAEAFKGSDVETIRMCLHAILGAITQAPSIDIVRCKECKYFKHGVRFNKPRNTDLENFCIYHMVFGWNANAFCSYGEKE
jgi:hypothetical protein